MARNPYLECGKIINTHGCAGGVKVESYCNTPEDCRALRRVYLRERDGSLREMRVLRAAGLGGFVLFWLEGITDTDAAAALKERILYAAREDFALAPGEYFLADVIGMTVRDADSGCVYGEIVRTLDSTANHLYVVRTPQGEERLLPAVSAFVKSISYETDEVLVTPVEGLF